MILAKAIFLSTKGEFLNTQCSRPPIPNESEIKMDERLIMGDKPVIEYRKHRQELIDQK